MEEAYLSLKLTSAGLLLILTLLCSYLPWGIQSRFKKSKIIMSYLNCLAGGVVLGALLMHMIPELSHSHTHGHGDSGVSTPTRDTPLILPDLASKGLPDERPSLTEHDMPAVIQEATGVEPERPAQTRCCRHGLSHSPNQERHSSKKHAHNHAHAEEHHHHSFNLGCFFAGVSFLVLLAVDRLFLHSHSHSHDHGHEHGVGKRPDDRPVMSEGPSPAAQCSDLECAGIIHSMGPEDDDCASCHSEDLVGGCHMDGLDSRSSSTQAFVFVVALSLHSFLEGLGAAAQSNKENIFMYLISLFGHKWLEAFALGVNVLNAKFSAAFGFLLIAFYSSLTPLGIALGMLFKVTMNSVHVEAILNGCAVGSFIFVSCIEMIPPEFHKRTSHTFWKFITLCVGFLVMSILSSVQL